jgi:hypothetical protein
MLTPQLTPNEMRGKQRRWAAARRWTWKFLGIDEFMRPSITPKSVALMEELFLGLRGGHVPQRGYDGSHRVGDLSPGELAGVGKGED